MFSRRRKSLVCCCCPPKKVRLSVVPTFITPSALSGLGPFSQYGVHPDVIQFVDPLLYELNNQHEESLEGGSKSSGFPADPLFPSDPRSQCDCLTPKYRGGQNSLFSINDTKTNHGNGSESLARTDGSFYSWDGVTTYYPYVLSSASDADKLSHRQGLFNFVFPNGSTNRVMRGLEGLYLSKLPFSNPSSPTVKEIENWNVEVVRHFRNLLGLNYEFSNDQELFIASKWSTERQSTNIWNKYPSTGVKNYGPCPNGASHCGGWFSPTELSEQLPYWNDYNCSYPSSITKPRLGYYNSPYTADHMISYTEGILWTRPGTWMTIMSELIWELLKNGVYEGHHVPFFLNKKWGYHFMSGDSSGGTVRIKWSWDAYSPPAGYII